MGGFCGYGGPQTVMGVMPHNEATESQANWVTGDNVANSVMLCLETLTRRQQIIQCCLASYILSV